MYGSLWIMYLLSSYSCRSNRDDTSKMFPESFGVDDLNQLCLSASNCSLIRHYVTHGRHDHNSSTWFILSFWSLYQSISDLSIHSGPVFPMLTSFGESTQMQVANAQIFKPIIGQPSEALYFELDELSKKLRPQKKLWRQHTKVLVLHPCWRHTERGETNVLSILFYHPPFRPMRNGLHTYENIIYDIAKERSHVLYGHGDPVVGNDHFNGGAVDIISVRLRWYRHGFQAIGVST